MFGDKKPPAGELVVFASSGDAVSAPSTTCQSMLERRVPANMMVPQGPRVRGMAWAQRRRSRLAFLGRNHSRHLLWSFVRRKVHT